MAQYDDDTRALLRPGTDALQIHDGAGAEMADRALSVPPHPTEGAT